MDNESDIYLKVDSPTRELERQKIINERLLTTMDVIVIVLDRFGAICRFNPAAEKATGFSFEELRGVYVWDSLIPPEQRCAVEGVFSELVAGMFPNHHRNDWLTKQGTRITIDWSNSALEDDTGQVEYVFGTGTNITPALQDQKALELSALAFESQEAMVITDHTGGILKVNRAFEEVSGYKLEEIQSKNMNIFKSGWHDAEFYKQIWRQINKDGFWQGEMWSRRKNGEIFPEFLRITRLLDDKGKVVNYIGNFSDITQRKKIEQELEFLGFYDPVTQLPNRRLLNDRLEQALMHCQHSLGVMFLDLDNFKQINDTFGHVFGDLLLEAFAQKLQALLPQHLTISRFGGDEFVILLSELDKSLESASFQCEHIAQIILCDLENGLEISDQKIHLSSSIGIVVTDKCNMTAETLLKQADTAMYQAKEMGKNTFRFYTDSIGERITEHYKMGMALRQDLSKGGAFHVVYQPQYNAEKIIIGAEALVRWYSEEYGLVSPMQFIPIAEESGLINEIGLLVVEQVLTDMITMDEIFIKTALRRISINLSIKQLTNPNLSTHLLQLFEEKEVAPSKVRFEFTESVFLDKALDPKVLFSEMSDNGFSFSLDDFGTGFSSLSYLKELPISELKIDQSFVDGIPHEDSDTTICSATISMAKNLGLELVAEGVETQAQFDWLVAQGCDILQGYLMSKPIEFKAFIKLLNAQT